LRYPIPTIEEMQKHLISYRDNMRVEVKQGIPVNAKTVADLRALSTWPDGLVLNIHVDLDPRLSVLMPDDLDDARPPPSAALTAQRSYES
jgi:hypothetical protein